MGLEEQIIKKAFRSDPENDYLAEDVVLLSDVLAEIGDSINVKKGEVRDQIIRLMQIRAGSLYDNHFEAGVIYANLKLLGWTPKWRTREEVAKWITDVVYSAHTSEEAETKLNQILKGEK